MLKKYMLIVVIVFHFNNLFYAQTKNVVIERTDYGINLIQNKKTEKYIITDKNNKLLFKNLRGVRNLGRGYQAINSKNKLINIFINKDILELKPSVNDIRWGLVVCGTVSSYKSYIKDTLDYFEIFCKTDNDWFNQEGTTSVTNKISKRDADECFFINYEKQFSYDGNYPQKNSTINILYEKPETIIFKKNNSFGIWGKTKAIYDEIKIVKFITKIKKNNLYSYYEIHKNPKYKILEDFIGAFARFELTNGKRGYLTGNGHEYFDE